jgi:pimeloyl-ACP methyl ester carboxylesterase
MQAFFFGEDQRRLLGLFHAASRQPSVIERPAVLICGPHGQEAVRGHRLLRVLADRLSRAGHDVLRFDPYGSGDSAGDDHELHLKSWRQDVLSAAQQLQRLSRARAQLWIGFRLGAAVACQAAASDATVRPRKLLLVEPVGDGPQYLAHLALATVQTLEASMSIKSSHWRQSLSDDPHRWQIEAAGFALGPSLHQELTLLREQDLVVAAGVSTDVIVPTESQREQVLSWPWRCGPDGLAVMAAAYDFDWTSEEALNSAWVPHGLVAQLMTSAATCPLESVVLTP